MLVSHTYSLIRTCARQHVHTINLFEHLPDVLGKILRLISHLLAAEEQLVSCHSKSIY